MQSKGCRATERMRFLLRLQAASGKACAVSDIAQRSRDKEVLESFALWA